jgi:hypothetical protein
MPRNTAAVNRTAIREKTDLFSALCYQRGARGKSTRLVRNENPEFQQLLCVRRPAGLLIAQRYVRIHSYRQVCSALSHVFHYQYIIATLCRVIQDQRNAVGDH